MQKLTRFTLLIVALLTPISLLATEDTEVPDPCPSVIELAEQIMSARQAGVSMAELMEVMENKYQQKLVLEAYQIPLYTTQEYRDSETTEFGNKHGVACYEAMLR